MNWYYFISDSTNPYENLAYEQALMDCVCKSRSIDLRLVYLWQNNNTIVIGRNQDAYREIKIEEFISQDGIIARRKSGGGAVYHDLGNLNYSFIQSATKQESYQEIMVPVFAQIGIAAEYNGRNDLIVDKRKISGNAEYIKNNVSCQHGTVLVYSDIDKIERFLTPPKEKLDRNSVKSVSSRVINLSKIDETITVERLKQTIINYLSAERYDAILSLQVLKKYKAFFADKEWIYRGVI